MGLRFILIYTSIYYIRKSRPISSSFKNLRQKVERTFRDLPWKMDPRTKRSLGRCVQLLMASRSSRLSRWAVFAKNRLKKPLYEIKRFSRLLANLGIDQNRLAEHRIKLFRSQIKKDTPIACDFSAVEWPYAKKVQDVCGVWDGAQKKVIQGHWWLKATARFSSTVRLPLLSLVFSHLSLSFISMNRTVIDFVTPLADLLQGRGIWLFDRGFDNRILIEAFLKLGIRFSIRINACRNIWPQPFHEAGFQKKDKILLEKLLTTVSYPFPMTLPIYKKKTKIRFGFCPIQIPGIDFPLWVIYTSGTHDPLILLTHEPVTSKEEAKRMIRMYASRWGVEESFRDFNEEFDVQHIMVRTLRRINLLFELALWAYSFATTFFHKGKGLLKKLIHLGGRIGIKKKAEQTFGRILKGLQYLFAHSAQAP